MDFIVRHGLARLLSEPIAKSLNNDAFMQHLVVNINSYIAN